jgi:hypothetical protein
MEEEYICSTKAYSRMGYNIIKGCPTIDKSWGFCIPKIKFNDMTVTLYK